MKMRYFLLSLISFLLALAAVSVGMWVWFTRYEMGLDWLVAAAVFILLVALSVFVWVRAVFDKR